MKKLEDIVSENELILLRYYSDSLSKIKQQMLEAAVKGYDTKHLERLQKNVETELTKLEKKFQFYSTERTAKVYSKGVKGTEAMFKQLHLQFNPVKAVTYTQFAGLHKNAIKTLAINTYKPLKRVVDVIGRDCIEYFERTNFNSTQEILRKLLKLFPDNEDLRASGLASVQGVVNGNITWQRAIKDFQEDFIKDSMFKVPYYKKDGSLHALVDLKSYAELVARTTSAEAYRTGEETTILETFDNKGDLVQVIGHSSFPNSPCIPFEDAFLSLRGITKGYTTIDEAKAQGLFHPNCIHHFGVTFEVLEEYERIEAGNAAGTVLKETEGQAKPKEKERKRKSEFKPAQTIQEAKDYADGFVKGGKSSFDKSITLENLNQFNEHLTYLTKKYKFDEFETIGSFSYRGKKNGRPLAHANKTLLEIEKNYGAFKAVDFEEAFKRNNTNFRKNCEKGIAEWSAFLGKPQYNQSKVKKQLKIWKEQLKFTRFTVQHSAKEHFKDTVTHEFAHSLMYRAIDKEIKAAGKYELVPGSGIIRNKLSSSATQTYKKVANAFYEARRTGDIYKISYYGASDMWEFFAECFTIYEKGVEKLPDYINNVIKEVSK